MKNKDLAKVRGSLVAIVTPMDEAGGLDLAAFRKLIDWHIPQRIGFNLGRKVDLFL